MKNISGVNMLSCKVNGLPLNFIFDTGADVVTISLTEALFMIKNNYLSKYDIFGISHAQLANGDITENTEIVLREIEIEGYKIKNVKALIVHNSKAPLLLGKSAMRKLGKIQIEGNRLTIYPKDKNSINGKKFDIKLVKLLDENGNPIVSKDPRNLQAAAAQSGIKKTVQISGIESYQLAFCYDYNGEYEFTDIDNDDLPELILSCPSGGICCHSEILFTYYGNNKFKRVFEFQSSPSSLFLFNEEIEIVNYDTWRYFYTCGACDISDELPYYVPFITKYQYQNGIVKEYSVNNSFSEKILENLKYLSTRGRRDLGENDFDDGTRKAYLQMIYLYYKYNNEDISTSKLLFYKYYTQTDIDKIWQEIVETFK